MGDRQNQKLSWFAGTTKRDRGDEPRKHKRSGRPKHRQNQRSTYSSPERLDRGSTQQKLIGSEELASSSSEGSVASIPSDNFTSRIRELATRVSSEDDRYLLEKVGQHIQDKDREMRKAVTTIAKMHKADNQKRDDRFFVKQTKTLRAVIENWSKTQTILHPSLKADAKAKLLRISKFVEILESVGLSTDHHFGTGSDVSRLLQAYMWAVLEREVFGRSRWAGDANTFVDLKAAVVPPDSTSTIQSTQSAQYHDWRAMTARLAEQNMPDERFNSISEQVGCSAMEPLQPNPIKTAADANVVGIVRRALDLDIEMSKQKALFYSSYLDRSSTYDSEAMDLIQDEDDVDTAARDSVSIDLYVAPALCKCTTSNGGPYDEESVPMNAEVLCSPYRTPRAASLQGEHRAPSPRGMRRAETMPIRTTSHHQVSYAENLTGGYRRC